MPKTVVMLPTYNEAENLPRMLEALLALPVGGLGVLVVDDTSPDGTGELADTWAKRTPDRVFVLHRKEKNGLGRAYVEGFKRALTLGADLIVQMDADFSHQPHYIPGLLDAARDSDMVIASRYTRGGTVDESWSPFRKLLSWFANSVYVRVVMGLPVSDATGGFRVWRRPTLIGIDLDRIRSNGYICNVELTYVTHRLGYKIREEPIHFPDRELGESKMSLRIQTEAALRTWQIRQRHRHLKPPMRRSQAYV
ncbi:polyprenol monophosphomannose synthase [Aggregatilinea lenta]|uniref:polyprenol monophosphomannose synthase n=1 Tax=Aggregatilinea lenta TaxID=913108 RepID=UPI001EE92672|nr:polyprenol monophosphomannose synthase [Aggregatilinea lenta]